MVDMTTVIQGLICMSKKAEDRVCYDSCPYKKRIGKDNDCNYMVCLDTLQKMTDQAREIAQLKQDYTRLYRRWMATQPEEVISEKLEK